MPVLSRRVSIARWHFNLVVIIGFWVGFVTGAFTVLEGTDMISAESSGSGWYQWEFSTSEAYSVSSALQMEVNTTDGRGQMRIQNYISDANTKFLAHFDETSGAVVTDSSSNANNGTLVIPTPTPAVVWTEGKLNGSGTAGIGAVKLDGKTMFASVPDTDDKVSLTGNHTVEAWIKSESGFTPNVQTEKQIILDKGEYQLYVDPDTNKLVYQMAQTTTPTWIQAGGNEYNFSWDLNGKLAASTMTGSGSLVYVGTGYAVGDTEVFVWNGTVWEKIGGNLLYGSWEDNLYTEVASSVMYGNKLVVGMGSGTNDADVWIYDPDGGTTRWTQIGGDSLNQGTGPSWDTGYEEVRKLLVYQDTLLAGLGLNTAGDGELWKCDLTNCSKTTGWTKIGGDAVSANADKSWTNNKERVWSMVLSGSRIFVGLGDTGSSNPNSDSEVWTCADVATCTNETGWKQVGGDGLYGGWGANYEYVSALAVYTDTTGDVNLLAGLGVSSGDAELWRCNVTDSNGDCSAANSWGSAALVDGNTGSGTEPQSWNNSSELIISLIVDDQALTDYVYVGLGSGANDARVWTCDLAGTCNNTSGWDKIGGGGGSDGWSATGSYTYVRSMYYDGTNLYAALQSTAADSGEVWQRTSGTWTQIGGKYYNGSWGFSAIDSVSAMTKHNNKLYLGTGYTAGDATVWDYDGSYWFMRGGRGMSGSWAAADNLETVESLISYKGNLYAGTGNTANSDDGELWKLTSSSSTWSQIGGVGGTGTNNWVDADNVEVVSSLAADEANMFVGLGNNNNDDGRLFSYDDTSNTFTQIGGKKSPALSTGWQDADNIEIVLSLLSDGKYLFAGLGSSADDGDVWMYDKTAGTWSQLANAGAASSSNGNWYNINDIEGVYSLAMYNDELYAGLGASTGDAKIYKYNFSTATWTQVAGSGAAIGYGSYNSDYEVVYSLNVYNGYLYAGLGNEDGDGEIWQFDGSTWSRIGGPPVTSWAAAINKADYLTVYKDKLYAATGTGGQTEAQIWSWGNNVYLESDAALATDTNWHHVAVSYDGSTFKMYVDGSLQDNTVSSAITPVNSSRSLLIGRGYGNPTRGIGTGYYSQLLDEIRISNTTRSLSDLVYTTYARTGQYPYIQPAAAQLTEDVAAWTGFSVTDAGVGTYRYCLSINGGTIWKYWDGDSWETTDCNTAANASSESDINDNIGDLGVSTSGIIWRAVMEGNGEQQAYVSNIRIDGTFDNSPPEEITGIHVYKNNAQGDEITGGAENWYDTENVFVSWDPTTDSGAGLAAYYVTLGEDDATPITEATASADTNRIFANLTSDDYYLKIVAVDNASNATQEFPTGGFVYRLDASDPTPPLAVEVSPPGYASTNSFTFVWPEPGEEDGATDSGGSEIAGYKYRINTGDWSETITDTQVTVSDTATSGTNTFEIKTLDNAGNESTVTTVNFYLAGDGPDPVNNLRVDDTPKTENLFTFYWDPPDSDSYLGNDPTKLRYCYTFNAEPNADRCTNSNIITGVTSAVLGPGAYATQNSNTLYVIAMDGTEYGGAVTYSADHWATVAFVANTTAPGLPTNVEASDISVKSTSTWRLIVSWNAPTGGVGTNGYYKVYKSDDDGETYNETPDTTTGTSYAYTDLDQQDYYFKVSACDRAGSCSAETTAVSGYPTGKYTSAASITSGPASSSVTTKKATITWTTDRNSDSKVQYGTSAGSYGTTEPSNSTQTTDHSIALTNLSPGTTYYYKAKYTDEDGNTGTSSEKTFTTGAAPTVSDVGPHTIGLTTVTLKFKTNNASKVKIYYGKSSAFGGLKELSVATTAQEHSVVLEDLEDGTKYYYKINTIDSESAEYEGTILDFSTLPRPKISNVRIQQVTGTAQPTVLTSWDTNTETSSIVTYWEEGNTAGAKDEVNVALVKGAHRIIVRGLFPQTKYMLQVKGRDKAGNEAVSDIQRFTTSTDTRPPAISELSVEGSVSNLQANKEISGQLSVTWNTDEAATSQVEFGEGTGTTYSQKTQEDANLTNNHLVLISGLAPSKVYHLRILSKDKAGNEAKSIDTVTITPKITDSALDLVISNLQQAFGFLGGLSN